MRKPVGMGLANQNWVLRGRTECGFCWEFREKAALRQNQQKTHLGKSGKSRTGGYCLGFFALLAELLASVGFVGAAKAKMGVVFVGGGGVGRNAN